MATRDTGRVRTGFVLFLLSFLVYNLNMREISADDTVPTRLLALALIQEHRLNLDSFFRDYPAGRALPPWLQYVGGHYLSTAPVFPALLAAPIYFIPVRFLWVDPPLINLLSKLSGSLFTALSVLFVYLALRRLVRESASVMITLVYAFGTSTWSVSSQGLWGHGPAQLFMAIALYCVLRGDEEGRARFFDLAGLAAGFMFASRPQTTGFVGVTIVVYALSRGLKRGVGCLLLFGGAVLAVLSYNLWHFGSIQGGYARLNATYMPLYEVEGVWSTAVGSGLLGLLLSPNRGLLIYSPVLVPAFVGILCSFLDRRQRVFHFLAAGLGASLLLLSAYSLWWGGHSFGPRLLSDFLPVFALFLAVVWGRIEQSVPLSIVFALLLAVSVGVQVIGAFWYPSPRDLDWNKTPRDVDVAHERLWDWNDTQVRRLLRNGPRSLGFGGWPSVVSNTPVGKPRVLPP